MEKGRSEIKAIVFDVGGVLAINENATKTLHKGHANMGVHNGIAKKLGISLDQWLDAIDTTYAKSIEGKISKDKTLQKISKNTKTPEKTLKKIIIDSYKRNFRENKQLFKHAHELKKTGYKIAVLSDQWHFSKEALMPKKLYEVFDEVIVSCDVGIRKPSPEIYKLVLKKLKTSAKKTLFIDNQEWNIRPAKKLGMNTILFKNNKQLFKQLKKFSI